MAAKGGGSNQGLIITLIFFVLATIILGVTTYLGFDGQSQLLKEKKDATKKATDWEGAANWYRYVTMVLRAYVGLSKDFPKDQESIGTFREQFAKGTLPSALDPSKDDNVKMVGDLEKTMGWDAAQNKAVNTYKQKIEELTNLVRQREGEVQTAQKALAGEKVSAATATKGLDDTREEYKKKYEELLGQFTTLQNDKKAAADKYLQDIDGFSKEVAQLKDDNAKLQESHAKQVEKLTKKIRELDKNLVTIQEKSGGGTGVNVLDFDQPKGKVEQVSATNDVYINLGRADNAKPQLTFSVYTMGNNGKPIMFDAVGIDGKPLIEPNTGKIIKEGKATLEIVRVLSPHTSLARLTSQRDPNHDPVIKGDVLFNPAWDPYKRPRVAVAGLADLTGDGSDNTIEFLRWLRGQNMDIDAYVDPKDVQIKGRGISRETDYVIIGDVPEPERVFGQNDPRGVRKNDIIKLIRDMEDQAREKAVPMITLRKYLVMTGFRMPKISAGAGAGYEDAFRTAERKEPAKGADKGGKDKKMDEQMDDDKEKKPKKKEEKPPADN